MKLDCEVIKDLLPLYHDGVCSAQSGHLVEEHLEQCPGCQAALEAMDGDLEVDLGDERKPLEKISREVKKGKRRAWMKGVATVLALVMLVSLAGLCYYGWWYWTERSFYQQFVDDAFSDRITPVDTSSGTIYYMFSPSSEDERFVSMSQYQYSVTVPTNPWEDGIVTVTHNQDMNYWTDARVTEQDQIYATTLNINRSKDGGYEYCVSVRNWDLSVFMIFTLDENMEQVYDEDWDEATALYYEQQLEELQYEAEAIIGAAKAQWTFLDE